MISIKKILNRRRQKKALNNIRRDLERKAKATTADIDIVTVENKSLFMVCPSCFNISKALRPGYAVQKEVCSYCGSEGADIYLISVQEYLQKNSLKELEELIDKIAGQINFTSNWKNMMCKGVKKIIELKRQELKRIN